MMLCLWERDLSDMADTLRKKGLVGQGAPRGLKANEGYNHSKIEEIQIGLLSGI